MRHLLRIMFFICLPLSCAYAEQIVVTVYSTNDKAESFGTVDFRDTPFGLLITPNLTSLPAGMHGFHLHEKKDCGNGGMNAGEHYDPDKTGTHRGPYDPGHLGDLPVLYVDADGKAETPTLAPRLTTADIKNKVIIIHAGGDDYSDTPHAGGGGARIGCGVID